MVLDKEETYPTCDGCHREIIAAQGIEALWRIVVKPPRHVGVETVGGQFCLNCMVDFATLGLTLHETRPEVRALQKKRRDDLAG